MLKSLFIENIALIEKLEVSFGDKFNILTGETGAGKSIIIDSLNFVLGERADKSLIKNGKEYAKVEAIFTFSTIYDWIKEFCLSINVEPEETLILNRYMSFSGKNECKVNGKIITLGMLKSLTKHFVDVLGQHDHQTLLDVKSHIRLLDSIKPSEISLLKQGISECLDGIHEINAKVKKLGGNESERAREIAILQHEIAEIESSDISEQDEEETLSRRKLLQHSQKISTAISETLEHLSEGNFNVLGNLHQSEKQLMNISEVFDDASKLIDRIATIRYESQDIVETLKEVLSGLEYSEQELNDIEARIDVYSELKRKFGHGVKNILTYLNSSKEKLYLLQNCEQELAILNIEKNKLLELLLKEAQKLTALRKQVASYVEQKIAQELQELGMKKATFAVVFAGDYSLSNIENVCTTDGADEVEFMFSANLGEPVKPLAKIISGGEMSRFMLAFKCVVETEQEKTFVFDEIDAGIGGDVGNIVARKLSKISRNNQVLCVTHLAQIASYADSHFKIEKIEREGKTLSTLTLLNKSGEITEIARMLGGKSGELALMHAKQMKEDVLKI